MTHRAADWLGIGVVALVALVASAAISWRVLDAIPHVTDGVAYLFQARAMASGSLWHDAPAVPLAFQQANLMLDGDRWFSFYTPGWPLLLAFGCLVGAPWLVNPLLLAGGVVAVGRLGELWFDRRTGFVAGALLAVSPFALLMGASHLSHPAALCAAGWCMVALATAGETGVRRPWLVAGALGGLAFIVRPYTAVALLWPAVVYALAITRSRRGDGLSALGWLAAGFAPLAVVLLAYQWILFGHPFQLGHHAFDPSVALTGMHGSYTAPATLLAEGLPWYLSRLPLLWSLGGPGLWLLIANLWPAPHRVRDVVLLLCAGSLLLAHSVYYYRDVVYSGPRLAFEVLGPVSLLLARAFFTLYDQLPRLAGRALGPPAERGLRAAVSLAALGMLAPTLWLRVPQQLALHAGRYHGVSDEPIRALEEAGMGAEALVFYSGPSYAYGSLFLLNESDPMAGDRVFARYSPALRDHIVALADRPEIWRVDVEYEPLPGPNHYPDRFELRELRVHAVRGGPPRTQPATR